MACISISTNDSEVQKSAKVALLKSADESVRGAGLPITQVAARYGDSHRVLQIANSEGLLTGDRQIRSSFSVSCVAAGDAGMQTGRESVGQTVGFELFEDIDVNEVARKAAERAVTKLDSVPAPSGEMPVVVGWDAPSSPVTPALSMQKITGSS